MRTTRIAMSVAALALCGGACGERLSLGELPGADGRDAGADDSHDATADVVVEDTSSVFVDAGRDALLASDAIIRQLSCEGKSCGEACSICPPGDTTCVESAEAKTCDLFGGCMLDQGAASCGDGGWKPCVGKTCNDPCDPCDPQDPNCVVVGAVFVCSPVGNCAFLSVSGC